MLFSPLSSSSASSFTSQKTKEILMVHKPGLDKLHRNDSSERNWDKSNSMTSNDRFQGCQRTQSQFIGEHALKLHDNKSISRLKHDTRSKSDTLLSKKEKLKIVGQIDLHKQNSSCSNNSSGSFKSDIPQGNARECGETGISNNFHNLNGNMNTAKMNFSQDSVNAKKYVDEI